MKEYPSWRVPERRVRKFFKRQSKEASSVAADSVFDDDEETSVNSVPKRVRNLAGRLFGGRRKNLNNNNDHNAISRQIPPILEIGEDIAINPMVSPLKLPQTSDGDQLLIPARFPEPESEPDPETEPNIVTEESTTIVEKSVVNDESLYKDDNDGKKERGPCAPCEGCVVI
jgi:hypothetical protein